MFDVKGFKQRLRTEREKKGLTQEKFADKIGIARASASYYENENNSSLPNAQMLYNMADELGVSCDYLLGKAECTKATNLEINKRLGLKDEAIENIEEYPKHHGMQNEIMEVLNKLLEDGRFFGILSCISGDHTTPNSTLPYHKENEMVKLQEDIREVTEDTGELISKGTMKDVYLFNAQKSFLEIVEDLPILEKTE